METTIRQDKLNSHLMNDPLILLGEIVLNFIYRLAGWLTTFVWGIVVGVLLNAIVSHHFWTELTPIIAHNHIENYLGWLIVFALCLSIVTVITKRYANTK